MQQSHDRLISDVAETWWRDRGGIMAKRKASNADSGAKRQRCSSHRAGFDPSWPSAYPWLVPDPVEQDSTVIGLRCWWCTQHSVERQRNRSGVWTELPCTSLRKDCIERHARSETHIRCAERELMREQALRDGGLQMAFQQQVVAQRKAVIGALKVVHWLAKEEIAYTTKYESLAAGHAANHVQYLQKFKATVQTLFLFYHNTPVRMAGLHAIQAILDSPIVKLKQAKDVRWLSYDAAIKAIISTFPALVASLEREATERSEPAAVGLVKFVKTHYFVGCCYLLNKVLPHISRLSLIFQQEDIDLTQIKPALESTLASIEEVRTFQFEEVYSTVENVLQISVSESEKQQFRKRVQYKFIDAVIDQINDRLPDCDELSAFSLLDPQKLPPCSGSEEINEAFQQWGNNHLVILEGTYGVGDNPDISKEALRSEWVSLKHMISSTYRNTTMRSMLKLLVSNSTLQTMYPQFTKLACIALVIPVSTAECERSFSAMKRIKTDSRNRLLTENLNHLMRISIEGPSIDQLTLNKLLNCGVLYMRQRRISI